MLRIDVARIREKGEAKSLTLNDAHWVSAAQRKKATDIKQPMNSSGCRRRWKYRCPCAGWMEHGSEASISPKRAYTARGDLTSRPKDLAVHSQSGGQFFGIHASNDGKIMIFAGGVPLKKDGKVVEDVGVSGGSGDQDPRGCRSWSSGLLRH